MKAHIPAVIFCIIATLFSCSKDDTSDVNPGLGALEGNIIYEYASDVKIINSSSWNESIFFSYNVYSTNNWDLSKDGKTRLISEREPGTIRETQFKLVNVTDGSIIKEFEYIPRWEQIGDTLVNCHTILL